MSHFYTYIALQIASDRAREAHAASRAARIANELPARPSVVRHALANGLAVVSRGSAAAVRRLDDCVADDLGRSLAASD
jgi:hypothetical protein